MDKIKFTVAIIGVGARGGDAYGCLINEEKEKFTIVSLCDQRQERLDMFGERFNVPAKNRFQDEEEFFKEKRADVLLIATPDKEHIRQAIRAFSLGYDIMVEKPLSDSFEECEALLAAQKKYGGKALVCHVLRYAPAFLKVKELLANGKVGKLVSIEAIENIAYWHIAHSYVRGNWRNTEVAFPIILAKCCHDLDLLQYYAGAKCKSVSSIGDIYWFKEENAPVGAEKKCVDCKYVDSCTYSAKKIYIDRYVENGEPNDAWPFNVVASAPVTKEKLLDGIKNTNYGNCVFKSDNNVVDNQFTQMVFENGVKASLTLTGFSGNIGRTYHFNGTDGEVILDERENTLVVWKFGEEKVEIKIDELIKVGDKGYSHGGGDYFLVQGLYEVLTGNGTAVTSLEASVESHLIGMSAEKSRLQNGEWVCVHEN